MTCQRKIPKKFRIIPKSIRFLRVAPKLVGCNSHNYSTIIHPTKTLQGNEHTLVIHTFSRYRGSKETKEIMSRVYALLHESSLTVSGASLVNLRFEFSDIIKENDGLTTHGLQRFRAMIFDS